MLFLDELAEFKRNCLEALREPLEAGEITISRARYRVTYPARFQLVAAMNPCPCGFLGDTHQDCQCSPEQVQRYRARLSGPLLDRIDLHVPVTRIRPGVLLGPPQNGESSATVRARVSAGRQRQQRRQGIPNSDLDSGKLVSTCMLDKHCQTVLETAADRLLLSGRALHRTLRVARTIADLADSTAVREAHVSEALAFRGLDRGYPGAASD